MTINVDDRQRASLLAKCRTKTLGQLESERLRLERNTEAAHREINLLVAMVAGLLDHKPEEFGAKVEQLRHQQSALQEAIGNVSVILQVISQAIGEKEREL